jgi:hypothetical protein
MIVTTIEQSKHLLELGLKADTCDMHYEYTTEEPEFKLYIGGNIAINKNLFSYRNGHVIPAWSLDAMLELIPQINLWRQEDVKGWTAEYKIDLYTKRMISCDTPFKATYEMLCELLEKGYIKKAE